MGFGPIVPTLAVESLRRSLEFYRERLGFEVRWGWSDDAGFEDQEEPSFVCIGSGDAVLFLGAQSAASADDRARLFIEVPLVEQVDELAQSLSDLDFVTPLADEPWGSREFTIQDPDGHVLRFSCPLDRRRDA